MNDQNQNEHIQMTIFWSEDLDKICPVCGRKVKFAYKSNPRNVITLEGVIIENVHYYKCSNPDCELHQ
ncbi:MAG: hypothetical protein ACTSRZ_12930, partial [Promethearchaeota archaeon]